MIKPETVIKAAVALTKIDRPDLARQMYRILARRPESPPWTDMPKDWTKATIKKFWKSVGGSVKKCMSKMEGKVDDPGAFCASIKDIALETTYWRGKGG